MHIARAHRLPARRFPVLEIFGIDRLGVNRTEITNRNCEEHRDNSLAKASYSHSMSTPASVSARASGASSSEYCRHRPTELP